MSKTTKTTKTIFEVLSEIQSTLKAPKNQMNTFGGYKYRNAEDILEALKPLLKDSNTFLLVDEEIKEVAGYLVTISTVALSNGEDTIKVSSSAGIDPDRKGMDIAQSFGASSSYAKKYALSNMFLLDDTKDPDETTKSIPKKVAKVAPKKKLDAKTLKIMTQYISEGKASIVKSKLDGYTMTKPQKDTLDKLMMVNEKINDEGK